MTANDKKNSHDLTLKELETQLRRLGDVEVPEELEPKLLAAIPRKPKTISAKYHTKWSLRGWDFSKTAAAAILIIALLFMVDYGLSTPSHGLSGGFTDTSLCYTGWGLNDFLYDQNNTMFADINYTNYNGLR